MTNLSSSDRKVLDDVETHGWHVVKVMGDETGPGFGYSVGLWKTFRHPEIIIIGLKLDLIHFRWFYQGNSFQLLQCIYPTKENIYPWEENWPEEISNLQPVLVEEGLIFP